MAAACPRPVTDPLVLEAMRKSLCSSLARACATNAALCLARHSIDLLE
ncbi:hypothetical protein [Methylobacterium terrae]|nr:hypothetical protein [Methylobacterium terrae]